MQQEDAGDRDGEDIDEDVEKDDDDDKDAEDAEEIIALTLGLRPEK